MTAPGARRRPLVLAGLCSLVLTGALLPISHQQLGPTVGFMPAMISVVACFDLISVYLLVGEYSDRGDRRLLLMACAYGWSLILMAGYALAFPGAVAVDPPLAVTPSTAPYMYIAWHGGFPVLLGAAWIPWNWLSTPTRLGRRRLVATVTLLGAGAFGFATVAFFLTFGERLPVLIEGLDTSRMTQVTAPVTLPLVLLALAVTVYGTWRRTGPERWAVIVVLVCTCDLVLTYYAANRFSLGWYAGRSLTLVSAAVVLAAMLVDFRDLKSRAEHDAAFDALTGLHNRRSAYLALNQLAARARRSGSPLSVLSVDLDFFKNINDTLGHETGDAVLAEVGRVMAASCRTGDVVARVGGEEFLVMLPDTAGKGALLTAERIRRHLREIALPKLTRVVTASMGAATLERDDLDAAMMLRRADVALYRAKAEGKDRVVVGIVTGSPTLSSADLS